MKQRQEHGVRSAGVASSLGKKIHELRLDCGLTQEDLAEASWIHPVYLGDIERGKRLPSIAVVSRIAEALVVPIGILFGTVPEPTNGVRNKILTCHHVIGTKRLCDFMKKYLTSRETRKHITSILSSAETGK